MPIVKLTEFVPGAVARPFAPKPVAQKPVPFGPRPKTARNKLAGMLGKVRKTYLGAAQRRNTRAIKQGILSRTPAPNASSPSGLTMSTERILQALIALEESLLVPASAGIQDVQYQNSCMLALRAESFKRKERHHARAAARAGELKCIERAERHQRLVTALTVLNS